MDVFVVRILLENTAPLNIIAEKYCAVPPQRSQSSTLPDLCGQTRH
jgi:hypothetical protein